MLADILTILAVGLLLLFLWLARGNWGFGSSGDPADFRDIDLQALRNLMSKEEDDFLRTRLSRPNYAKLRRVRVRATQQYLGWIAENCSILLRLLAETNITQEREVSAGHIPRLARSAVRLRLLCLGIWALLWLEYVFPVMGMSPKRLVRSYERMKETGAPYITGRAIPQPTRLASERRV